MGAHLHLRGAQVEASEVQETNGGSRVPVLLSVQYRPSPTALLWSQGQGPRQSGPATKEENGLLYRLSAVYFAY